MTAPTTTPVAKRTLSTKNAVTIVCSTLAAVIVALAITAGFGTGHDAITVPERTILAIDSGQGAKFETDLPVNQADHLVRVNDQYLHINLATSEVEESGWQLTRVSVGTESPIQAYDLSRVK